MAAPLTPKRNTNMNKGSNAMLVTSPATRYIKERVIRIR